MTYMRQVGPGARWKTPGGGAGGRRWCRPTPRGRAS